MGLRDVIITALAAAALALPSCRYQNMQATNAQDQSTPYYDLECHLEQGRDLAFEQDVAFSFSPYGCSCNPRLSYAIGSDRDDDLVREFGLDFELGSLGGSHVRASSRSVSSPESIVIYNEGDPRSTMQDIPMEGGTTEEEGIRARTISLWQGLWPLFYDTSISGGGPLIDRMTRVCVEDDIAYEADCNGYIILTESY